MLDKFDIVWADVQKLNVFVNYQSLSLYLHFNFTLFIVPTKYPTDGLDPNQKRNALGMKLNYFWSYLPNPSARAGYDTRSIFKQSLTGLNSEFSFS